MPKADILRCSKERRYFDYLVGQGEHIRRNIDAQRFGCREVGRVSNASSLGDVGRYSARLIFGKQLGGRTLPRLAGAAGSGE